MATFSDLIKRGILSQNQGGMVDIARRQAYSQQIAAQQAARQASIAASKRAADASRLRHELSARRAKINAGLVVKGDPLKRGK